MEKYSLSKDGMSLEISKNGVLEFTSGGSVWQSPALLVVNYYDRQHPRAQAVMLPTSDSVAFGTPGTLSMSAKGFFEVKKTSETSMSILADFPEIQLSFPVSIILDIEQNGFRVEFDSEKICEEHSRLYRILSIEVLPCFGAAKTADEGYLVLPNWCGSQMFFNHNVSRELRQTVYSSNDQWEYCCYMPCFGINRSFGTLSGLLTAGENDARLVCRQHWESEQLNSVHAEFVLRWEQQDEIIPGKREMRYSFAPTEYENGEGYVHVGHHYRNWLENEKNLLSWDEKAKKHPEVADYRDRFFLKIFMGFKEPHPDGKGKYHSTCTFAEAREILDDLLASGVEKICAILVGWNIDGHDGMPPTRFPVDERLGGESAMRELIAWCKSEDIMLGVHDSYGASYNCSEEHNLDDLIHHRSGEYWESVIWSGGQAHKVCPAVYVDKYVKRDIPMIADLGVHGHHHIDAVGSFMPCFNELHPLPMREDSIKHNRRMFEIATDIMGSVSTEMPFGSYFDVVDGFFHSYTHLFPWFKASVAAKFSDNLIPLLAIATHGSIKSMHSVKSGQSAHMAAYGLAPQTEVCVRPSPQFGVPSYETSKSVLLESYEKFYAKSGLSTLTENKKLEAVFEIAPKVRRMVYEGGVEVTANESDVEYNGVASGEFIIQQLCLA